MSDPIVKWWHSGSFDGWSTRELHDIIRLRIDTFVVEQNCVYPELDGYDMDATHLVGKSEGGTVLAYCRIIQLEENGVPHIGRVVVPKEYRGQGLGKELMREALIVAELYFRTDRSIVSAQAHLQKFYADFGYIVTRPEYLLDGIPHVDMERGERPSR